MNGRSGLPALVLAALMTTGTAQAFDCSSRIELPPRPQLKFYSDYSLFIANIVKYKNLKRDELDQRVKCPELYTLAEMPAAAPETLNGAVQSAASSPTGTAGNMPANLSGVPNDLLASTSILTPLTFIQAGADGEAPKQLPSLPFDIMDALNSGDPASQVLRDYLSQQLPQQDSDVGSAFMLALNGTSQTVLLTQNGNLSFQVNADGDILQTFGNGHYESCLSSGSITGCYWDANGHLVVPGSSSWGH